MTRDELMAMPALAGVQVVPHGQVLCYCPYCNDYHLHGAETVGTTTTGSKVAHCVNPASPLLHTGYRVALAVNWTEAEFRAAAKFVMAARRHQASLLRKKKKRKRS